MGLLDSLLGALGASSSSGQQQGGVPPELLQAVLGLIRDDGAGGGLSGLIQKFEQSGLGPVIGSWISSGQNQPISAEQLQSVLGSDTVSALGSKLGMAPGDVALQLSNLLPGVVDRATPEGRLPESGLGDVGSLARALGVGEPRH